MLKPAVGTSAPKREPGTVAVNIINLRDTTGGSAISLFLFFRASELTALLKTSRHLSRLELSFWFPAWCPCYHRGHAS